MSQRPLLSVRDVAVSFSMRDGRESIAVNGASFTVYPRQTLAIVGESGSGKSVTAMSILRLLPSPPAKYLRGSAMLSSRDGHTHSDLMQVSERELLEVRGGRVAMIFQEPMTSLNPVVTVGDQIAEAVALHRRATKQEARGASVAAMEQVGIADAESRASAYPHEFSGGMRQRVMIAMALACRPQLLLADEPTTALDVTVQAQILDLIADMRRSLGMGVVLITHDLGVVASRADVVCVMYAGRVVEYADVFSLFARPIHPYTRGLLASIPSGNSPSGRLKTVHDLLKVDSEFLLAARDGPLHAWWPSRVPSTSGMSSADLCPVLAEIEPGHWASVWSTTDMNATTGSWPDLSFSRSQAATQETAPAAGSRL